MPSRAPIASAFVGLVVGAMCWPSERALGANPVLPSDLRYVVNFSSTVDGQASDERTAAIAFNKALLHAHITLVDETQSKAAERAALESLSREAHVSAGLSGLQADVLVQVHVQAAEESVRLSDNVHRYRALLSATWISVGTGQVLGSISSDGAGLELTKERALALSQQRGAEALAKAFLDEARRDLARVELLVHQLGDPSTLEASLAKIPGILRAQVIFASKDVTKLSLITETKRFVATSLRETLEKTRNLGLRLDGQSDHALLATYVPSKAVRYPLLLSTFRGTKDWNMSVPKLLGAALQRDPAIDLIQSSPVELGMTASKRLARAKRAGVGEHELVLSGEILTHGREISVIARIECPRPEFQTVIESYAGCGAQDITSCVRRIAEDMHKRLPDALRDQGIEGVVATETPLALERLSIDKNIFFARGPAYATRGIGEIVVQNTSKMLATHGQLFVQVDGFKATTQPVRDIPPGGRRRFKIPFVYDRAPPTAEDERSIDIALTYKSLGQTDRVTHVDRVFLLPPDALDWSEPASIAAFVRHDTPEVQSLSDEIRAAIPKELSSEPLAIPAGIFSALSGLRYVKDPVYPGRGQALDRVQFPEETLNKGSGDCDDLAVLYAALADALGRDILFLLTPGHVLVAIDSGFPAHNAPRVSLDERRLFRHGGRLFLPIETTLAHASFEEAWAAGGEMIHRTQGTTPRDGPNDGPRPEPAIQVIELRDAWRRYPAVAQSDARARPRRPTPILRADTNAGGTSGNRYAYRPSLKALAGVISALRTKRQAAIDLALHQLRKDTEPALALTSAAELLTAVGRTREARALLEAALTKNERPEIKNNLANTYLALGERERALSLYQSALSETDVPRDRVRVLLNLALVSRDEPNGASLSSRHLFEAIEASSRAGDRAIVEAFLDALETVVPAHRKAMKPAEVAAQASAALAGASAQRGARFTVTSRAPALAFKAPPKMNAKAMANFVFWLSTSPAHSVTAAYPQ